VASQDSPAKVVQRIPHSEDTELLAALGGRLLAVSRNLSSRHPTDVPPEVLVFVVDQIRTRLASVRRVGAGEPDVTEKLKQIETFMDRLLTADADHRMKLNRVGIVNDVLDISKIEASNLELVKAACDPRLVVDDVIRTLNLRAQGKGLALISEIVELPPVVLGDQLRLRQVLMNLIANAIKFTHRGHVRVTAGKRAEHQIVFEVSDTGIGIPVEAQSRLFQPFVQADGSITREYGGTGLGLAISKRLVEIMGGEIGFSSRPCHGSTFWFTLPVD
jgi:signal transduction histidine kinase